MADASFLFVTIDAVAKAASFWSSVLGTEIDDEFDEAASSS